MANTSKLGLPLLANAPANQTLANTTFALINQLLMAGVVDKDLSTPPSSPANESLYIVASGNWGTASSKAGQLAFWLTDVGAWTFIVPRAGWAVRVLDEIDSSGLPRTYGYTGSAWVQQIADAGAINRYDLAVVATTSVLDLSASNRFTVDASTARTLSFTNAPGSSRAMTVSVLVNGTGTITWPSGITWFTTGGTPPAPPTSWAKITLDWDGTRWTGSEWGKA